MTFAERPSGRRWIDRSVPPPLRTMREFAESEIVIPDGDFAGMKFRCHRQPAHGLFFDLVDSGRWNRFAGVGPQQSGKSLAFYIIPALYHLFEYRETVICGLPSMDMAKDKWEADIKPAIEASRYRHYLPRSGAGSRGGTPTLITFGIGSRLKFMSGGGGDEKRSHFTSRVLVVTEADKLDESSETSREADKLKQMEGRTRFYRNRKRVYLECTVSTESGRIWQEYQNGTQTRILLPCPHCGEFVGPERDDLLGWQEAETEWEAEQASQFACPSCGGLWAEDERIEANRSLLVVHKGQEVTGDSVKGDPPKTRTLGFRYSAVNNMFAEAGIIGVDEWKAKRAPNEEEQENGEKELRQWTWAIPTEDPAQEEEPLEVVNIMSRMSTLKTGHLPEDVTNIGAGVDVRKRELHWIVFAARESGGPCIVEYGIQPVPCDEMELATAIKHAAGNLQDAFDAGWPVGDTLRPVDLVLMDSGWEDEAVFAAVKQHPAWMACKGFGHNQYSGHTYSKPKSTGARVIRIGDGYHVARVKRGRLVEINADLMKARLHRSLSVPLDHAQALLLPHSENGFEHRQLARHFLAEKETVEFKAGVGNVRKWVTLSRHNHWFDAGQMGFVALRMLAGQAAAVPRPSPSPDSSRRKGFVRPGSVRKRS